MMKKQTKINYESGQTFLEILLAFSISILVLGAVILGVTSALNNAQFTRNQGLANSYAQEEMSIVRRIRDSSWTTFANLSGTYCPDSDSNDLGISQASSCLANQNLNALFVREVMIYQSSQDCLQAVPPAPTPTPVVIEKGTKVIVAVYWKDNKCAAGSNTFCHKVQLISCFSNTVAGIDKTLTR